MRQEFKILVADGSEDIRVFIRSYLEGISQDQGVDNLEIFESQSLSEARHILDRTFLRLVVAECISPYTNQEEIAFLEELFRNFPLPPILIYSSYRATERNMQKLIDILSARKEYHFRYLERPGDLEELEVALITLLGFAPV
jgi:hypothetical protein